MNYLDVLTSSPSWAKETPFKTFCSLLFSTQYIHCKSLERIECPLWPFWFVQRDCEEDGDNIWVWAGGLTTAIQGE